MTGSTERKLPKPNIWHERKKKFNITAGIRYIIKALSPVLFSGEMLAFE
jgi:hypothetical protein